MMQYNCHLLSVNFLCCELCQTLTARPQLINACAERVWPRETSVMYVFHYHSNQMEASSIKE